MKKESSCKREKGLWVSLWEFAEDLGSSQTQQAPLCAPAQRMGENVSSGAFILSSILQKWGTETAALILETILDMKILDVGNLGV